VLRGLFGLCGGFLAFYAYGRLPLADAYSIIFATPLLITALAVPVLGEPVGWRRWSAVAVGFVGVLIMLQPGVAPIGPGSLAALGAACQGREAAARRCAVRSGRGASLGARRSAIIQATHRGSR
jgi:drug/metabolite transporter (DMT)-like permease